MPKNVLCPFNLSIVEETDCSRCSNGWDLSLRWQLTRKEKRLLRLDRNRTQSCKTIIEQQALTLIYKSWNYLFKSSWWYWQSFVTFSSSAVTIFYLNVYKIYWLLKKTTKISSVSLDHNINFVGKQQKWT